MVGDHCLSLTSESIFDTVSTVSLELARSPLSSAFVPFPGVQMWSQLDVTIHQPILPPCDTHCTGMPRPWPRHKTHTHIHAHTLWSRGHLLPTAVRFQMGYISSRLASLHLRPVASSSLQEASQCVCERERGQILWKVQHVWYEAFFSSDQLKSILRQEDWERKSQRRRQIC